MTELCTKAQLTVEFELPPGSSAEDISGFQKALGRLANSWGITFTTRPTGTVPGLARLRLIPTDEAFLAHCGVGSEEGLQGLLNRLPGCPGSQFEDSKDGWTQHRRLQRRLLERTRQRGTRSHLAEFDKVPIGVYMMLVGAGCGWLEQLLRLDVFDLLERGLTPQQAIALQDALNTPLRIRIAALHASRTLGVVLTEEQLARLAGTEYRADTLVSHFATEWWGKTAVIGAGFRLEEDFCR
ncbi:MAG TPA: hypothetical protein VI322_04275, partial [Candidatus Saccharimonadia bacterium]